MPTDQEKAALSDLLDDPSPSVRRSLLHYFQNMGREGERLLRQIAEGSNRIKAVHARWFITELRFTDPVKEFRGFIRSLSYELETGVILLCRTVHSDLNVSRFCGQLDRMAARCRELMLDALPIREKCRIINRVLFHEYGFRGNVEDYTDPENSYLHRVLETRKGLPISLSILYLLVAERCGVRLEPVGLPGHFVVGCYRGGEVFFIDPFDRGRFLTPEDLTAYLVGRNISPEAAPLVPTTVREVLCRSCRNLANHYAELNQPPLARLFASFVDEFEAAYEQNTKS